MRRKDKQIESEAEIQEIIRGNNICRIAYSDNNIPYITVLSYGYEDGFLYFHSAKQGRKLDFISKNSYVCFEITDSLNQITAEKACDFSVAFRTVVGYGNIEFITDADAKTVALNILMKQHFSAKNFEYRPEMLEAVNVLRLKIIEVTGKKNRIS